MITTPQLTSHPAARTLADDNVYVKPLSTPVDLLDRARRAVQALVALGDGADIDSVHRALDAERALPSQWSDELRQVPLSIFDA